MSYIMEFDDFDEAMHRMAEAERLANESVTDRQRDVVWGSYWLRAVPDGILEYGYVLTEEEATDPRDGGDTTAHVRERYRRGYRFSRCYSVLGEGMGDVHLAVLWPITKKEFELAQGNNFGRTDEAWENDMLLRVTNEMQAALDAHPSTPGSPQEES